MRPCLLRANCPCPHLSSSPDTAEAPRRRRRHQPIRRRGGDQQPIRAEIRANCILQRWRRSEDRAGAGEYLPRLEMTSLIIQNYRWRSTPHIIIREIQCLYEAGISEPCSSAGSGGDGAMSWVLITEPSCDSCDSWPLNSTAAAAADLTKVANIITHQRPPSPWSRAQGASIDIYKPSSCTGGFSQKDSWNDNFVFSSV